MRKKIATFIISLAAGGCVLAGFSGAVPAAQQTAITETASSETETGVAENVVSDTTSSTPETAAQTEAVSDFIDGSALLADYGYEAGTMTDKEWFSEFLDLKYVPAKGVKMAVDQNKKLNEDYYLRNGAEKQTGASEFAAMNDNGGYLQVSVIVNPNNEAEESLLERFSGDEKLQLTGKAKEEEIGGKTFKTMTGVKDKDRYLIGVSTDVPNYVIAFKAKYADTEDRDVLMAGFSPFTITETESEEEYVETEAEAVPNVTSQASVPEETEVN